jgi:hypothetical protein
LSFILFSHEEFFAKTLRSVLSHPYFLHFPAKEDRRGLRAVLGFTILAPRKSRTFAATTSRSP